MSASSRPTVRDMSMIALNLARVVSVSVGFRSKERSRKAILNGLLAGKGILSGLPAQKVGREQKLSFVQLKHRETFSSIFVCSETLRKRLQRRLHSLRYMCSLALPVNLIPTLLARNTDKRVT